MAAPTVPTFMELAMAAPVEILEEEDLWPVELVLLEVELAVALVEATVPLETPVELETLWAETATAAKTRATTDWNCIMYMCVKASVQVW